MRNHIIFKFLAIFLCATCLLGAVGSGVGLFVMAEFGNRSYSEVYQEATEGSVRRLARTLARRYASRNLGNADNSMLDHYYGNLWEDSFNQSQISYTIRDENGGILEQQAFYDKVDSYEEHTFSFEGLAYVNVISSMTREEYNALHEPAVTEPATVDPWNSENGLTVLNQVPMEGSEISKIQAVYHDGSLRIYEGGGPLGFLSYCSADQLWFDFHIDYSAARNLYVDLQHDHPVNMVFFGSDGEMVLDISHEDRVVDTLGDNYLMLKPLPSGSETPRIYDAIPPEGQTVYRCSVTYADGFEESVGSTESIGYLSYDNEGNVLFTADYRGILEERFGEGQTVQVTNIRFSDEDDNLVYAANDPEGVGYFFLENDDLCFRYSAETVQTPQTQIPEPVYVYDDVPPGNSLIVTMELQLSGDPRIFTVGNMEDGIGYSNHDDSGNVTFVAKDWKDFVFSKPAQVTYIRMVGEEDRLMYEAYSTKKGDTPPYQAGLGDPIGTFAYNEDGKLMFTFGAVPAAAALTALEDSAGEVPETTVSEETLLEIIPEETVSETAPEETIPETTAPAETVPETTEEYTQPEATEETSTEPTVSKTAEETVPPSDTDPPAEPTVPMTLSEEATSTFGYWDSSTGEHMLVEYTDPEMPAYTVELWLGPDAMAYQYEWVLLEMVYNFRDFLIPGLIVSLLMIAVTVVYLCCSAGRRPGTEEVHAGGLNRLPLDLYLVGAGGILLCFLAFVEGAPYLFEQDLLIGILYSVLTAFAASLLTVSFCFGFVAQIKTPGGYWWRNSLIGRSGKLIVWLWNLTVRLCTWCWNFCKTKIWPTLMMLALALWKLLKFFWVQLKRITVWCIGQLKAAIGWVSRKVRRFMSMLPLTWQWLMVGFFLVFFLYAMIRTYKVGYILIGFGAFFGVLLYAASAFGTLLESAKKMRQGDLDTKVDDKLLIGAFQDFADELNGLADVAVVAAQKQLKSERMKTELITNVSHDIKTPLTSIINYVDLMEKPHSSEEQQTYLEVLARQSQRLKKLIDDLMEMSKASTGNMAVEITKVNAAEAVNQALGEFADKLEKAQLTPVFRQPEQEIHMMADGRLVWRVLSNLLSNAVKYALPGTRVYIDLMELEGKVVLSLKNISRDSLNIHADELLERFVRGDTARNTEGSGLGLNIAQSLMELQKGKLELLVDGDLFKVTLIFPGA